MIIKKKVLCFFALSLIFVAGGYAKKRTSEVIQAKKIEKQEKKEAKRLDQMHQEMQADENRKAREVQLEKDKLNAIEQREKLMTSWKNVRHDKVAEKYTKGAFSDLYKRPAWPFEMQFAQHKDLLQVSMKYDYATTAYNSTGGTQNLAKLAFGEPTFDFQSLILALKMLKKGFLANNGLDVNLINYYYNKKILFYGKQKDFSLSLDFLRYIKDKDIVFGLQIPLASQVRNLGVDFAINPIDTTFYRTMAKEYLEYVLAPKHLSYLPKMSTVGLGEVSTFLNFQINTKYCEKLLVGLKVLWPTAKDADNGKLWAPELGEGFTRISGYGSVLFNHQRSYFNPHMFVNATYVMEGHKDKRVPKILSHTDNTAAGAAVGADVISFGDKVLYVQDKFFTEPDSTVIAFADNVQSVKMRPGPEIAFRLGNMWEKFIWRRAFLDMYYDFRAKWKDHIGGGLQRDTWMVDSLKDNTHRIEHKIGADLIYQIDAKARFQAGMKYSFAGINVPQTIEGTLAVNVEF